MCGLLFVSAVHAFVAGAQVPAVVYVAQPSEEAVAIIDRISHERIGTTSFAGLGNPIDVAATPDGGRLYVLLWNKVAVVDTATQVIADLTIFQLDENRPDRIAISADGEFFFLFGRSYAIDVTDLRSNSGASIMFGDPRIETGAAAITFSGDLRFAYALRNDHDDDGNPIALVAVIDMATLQIVNTLIVSGYASDIALSADNGWLYLALNGSLVVLDATTGRVLSTVAIRGSVSGVVANPTGDLVFAAGDLVTRNETSGVDEVSGHFVSVIDAMAQRVVKTVSLASPAVRMIPTPDGTSLFLILDGSGETTLSVMEITTGAITPILNGASFGIAVSALPPASPTPMPTPVRHPATGSYRAFVLSGTARTISVIDLATNALVDSIPLADEKGSSPSDMAIAPNGDLLYVLYPSGVVIALDPISHQAITTFPTPYDCYTFSRIAISPDGHSVYVTSDDAHSVFVIDVATNSDATRIEAAFDSDRSDQTGIAVSPNGSTVYVVWTAKRPLDRVGLISIIDTSRRSLIAIRQVGLGTGSIQFNSDGSLAYIAGRAGEGVTVVDTARQKLRAIIPIGGKANGIVLSPVSSRAYLGVANDGTRRPSVEVIDTSTNRIAGSISLPDGANPSSIGIRPDGRFVYVTLSGPVNVLAVVDTATNTVSATVPIGEGSSAMAIGRAPDGAATVTSGGCAIAGLSTERLLLLPIVFLVWRRRTAATFLNAPSRTSCATLQARAITSPAVL
jgi:YVTN family beta-propeller protein